MALKPVDVSKLPVTRIVAGKPRVSITDKGQAAFSSAAAKILNGAEFAQPLQDDTNLLLVGWRGVADAKGRELLKVSWPKNGSGCTISCAGWFQQLGYDYRKAGSQPYDAQVDEKRGIVLITLPRETPAPRPRVTRPRRNKAAVEVVAEKGGETELEI